MYQWIVSLNDGQRISSKELLAQDPKANPWTRVLDYLKNNVNLSGEKKEITHVELIINNRSYNSPSVSKNASFRSSEKFEKFWILQKASAFIQSGSPGDHYISFSYRVGEFRHFFWVNTKTNNCYVHVLNTINPETNDEKAYSSVEQDIENTYKEIDVSNASS